MAVTASAILLRDGLRLSGQEFSHATCFQYPRYILRWPDADTMPPYMTVLPALKSSLPLLSEEGCHCHGLLESWFLNNRSCKFEATSSSCGRGPSYCAGKNCTDCGVSKVEGTANTACSERECAAQEFSLLSAKRVSQERAAAENMRGYRKVHSKYLQRTRGAAGTQATTDASFGLSA